MKQVTTVMVVLLLARTCLAQLEVPGSNGLLGNELNKDAMEFFNYSKEDHTLQIDELHFWTQDYANIHSTYFGSTSIPPLSPTGRGLVIFGTDPAPAGYNVTIGVGNLEWVINLNQTEPVMSDWCESICLALPVAENPPNPATCEYVLYQCDAGSNDPLTWPGFTDEYPGLIQVCVPPPPDPPYPCPVGGGDYEDWGGTTTPADESRQRYGDGQAVFTTAPHTMGLQNPSPPLPVEMVFLSARTIERQGIAIDWRTASEVDNAGFVIERLRTSSTTTWDSIGWVDGRGTSAQDYVYSFLDTKPRPGTNYYRLRQVDYDGRADLSYVVSANWRGQGDIVIAPNPARTGQSVHVSYPAVDGETPAHLILYDGIGRTVSHRKVLLDNSKLPVPTDGLTIGEYYVQLALPGGVVYTKMLVLQ